MKFRIPALFLLFLISSIFVAAQKPSKTPGVHTTPPGNMSLLPGYEHMRRKGIDSMVGEIGKKDGLAIGYDIGGMAGNYAGQYAALDKAEQGWNKTLKVNDDDLQIVYLKNGRIGATFRQQSANFYADTKGPEEVVDFLLMVMTYDSKKPVPKSTTQAEYPAAPARPNIGDCWKATAPREMSILFDYEHSQCAGVDTLLGKIEKKQGMTIEYDIGTLAGNYALGELKHNKVKANWHRKLKANGDDLLIVYLNDGKISATYQDQFANFFGKTKSPEDVADFLLMIMTY